MSFRSLREILPRALEELGITEQVRREQVVQAWPAAAQDISPELAAHSRAVEFRDHALVVHVSTLKLARFVAERRADILSALNARLAHGAFGTVDPGGVMEVTAVHASASP